MRQAHTPSERQSSHILRQSTTTTTTISHVIRTGTSSTKQSLKNSPFLLNLFPKILHFKEIGLFFTPLPRRMAFIIIANFRKNSCFSRFFFLISNILTFIYGMFEI